MSLFDRLMVVPGRVFLGWFFISQAYFRVTEWDAMVVLIQMRHLPFAPQLLAIAILAMIFGGIGLILGFQTRFSAVILSICTASWAVVAHPYWEIRDPIVRADDFLVFALAVAVIGGLFVFAGFGGGEISLDAKRDS